MNENFNSVILKLETKKIDLKNIIEKKEKDVYGVEKTNEDCQNTMNNLKEEVQIYKKDMNELEKQNEQLEKKNKENKKADEKSNEQLYVKDEMLDDLAKKNEDLEDKINSLIDLLYGCNDCGRHGDYCECGYLSNNYCIHYIGNWYPTIAQ